MIPIRFTIINGITYFHYNPKEIISFTRLGFKDGNVGMVLTRREGNKLTYRGFGTIENPFTYIATISLIHFPPLDGEMPTDEQRLISPKPIFNIKDHSFTIFDSSK